MVVPVWQVSTEPVIMAVRQFCELPRKSVSSMRMPCLAKIPFSLATKSGAASVDIAPAWTALMADIDQAPISGDPPYYHNIGRVFAAVGTVFFGIFAKPADFGAVLLAASWLFAPAAWLALHLPVADEDGARA